MSKSVFVRRAGWPLLLTLLLVKYYYFRMYDYNAYPTDFNEVEPAPEAEYIPSDFLEEQSELIAVLGGNANPVYLFPLILTVKRWKELGVRSIVCVGNSEAEMRRNPATVYMLSKLIDDGVELLYLNTTLSPSHTISQTCRLFVASSPHLRIADDSLLMTSDGDLWPISLSNHLPRKGQAVFAYHSHCCGFAHYPWSLRFFRHYQISTIAMRADLWRDVMGIERNYLTDGDVLARHLYKEFSRKFIITGRPKPFISRSWFADQILLSDKLGQWRAENEDEFGEIQIVKPSERLFREWWPDNFTRIDLSRYREIHMPTPLHSFKIWEMVLPVIKMLFTPKNVEDIENYRKEVIRLL